MLVRLTGEWTDSGGLAHHAGETVEVDAATFAQLEAAGVVEATSKQSGEEPPPGWPGLT